MKIFLFILLLKEQEYTAVTILDTSVGTQGHVREESAGVRIGCASRGTDLEAM